MKMNKCGYLIREGFRSIKTHRFMSFASVTIILACLLIMGSFSLVAVNINSFIKDLEKENEIIAFVDEDYSESEARALQSSIDAVDNVADATFVTRQQAMSDFMSGYDNDLMEGIDKTAFRDRFVVQLKDISLMAQTKADLEKVDGVARVNAHVDYANSFITIRNVVSIVSLVLIVILVIVSFFIMSNTIKLATFSRREEIGIMKMVGATNGFIRLPFVVEGLTLGLLGGALAFLAEWGLYALITGRVMSDIVGQYVDVVPFSAVAGPVGLVFLAVSVLVGAFGGINAIRNYLKV
jgi:cell division transport system permease protein